MESSIMGMAIYLIINPSISNMGLIQRKRREKMKPVILLPLLNWYNNPL